MPISHEEAIKRISCFFDDKVEAEKMLREILVDNGYLVNGNGWTLEKLLYSQEIMRKKRVASGTPHKTSILRSSLDSIQGRNPIRERKVQPPRSNFFK